MLLQFSTPSYPVLLLEMARAAKKVVINSRTSNAALGQLAFKAKDPCHSGTGKG